MPSRVSRVSTLRTLAAVSIAACALPAAADSANDASDIASKLANPVAKLISVPFQFNYDRGMGYDGAGRIDSMKFQPVIPLTVNEDWNWIVRPIVPVEQLHPVSGFSGTGVGPIAVETFISPANATTMIWGVGPYLSFPSASGPEYGSKQWGAGVSFVGLYRPGGWTLGVLGYQSWDAGGPATGGTANTTYWQPIVSYVTHDAWTFGLNTESSYNWDTHRSSNPMNLTIAKLVYFDKLPVSFTAGARYYLTSVPGGASGWGARFVVTFVFPK